MVQISKGKKITIKLTRTHKAAAKELKITKCLKPSESISSVDDEGGSGGVMWWVGGGGGTFSLPATLSVALSDYIISPVLVLCLSTE